MFYLIMNSANKYLKKCQMYSNQETNQKFYVDLFMYLREFPRDLIRFYFIKEKDDTDNNLLRYLKKIASKSLQPDAFLEFTDCIKGQNNMNNQFADDMAIDTIDMNYRETLEKIYFFKQDLKKFF